MAGYEALPIVISHLSALVRKLHLYTRIAEQTRPWKTERICLNVVGKFYMQRISLANDISKGSCFGEM